MADSNQSDNNNNETTNVSNDVMLNKVFVGNLAFKTNFKSLKTAFAAIGTVERVNVVSKDGKRLGFGFVQFTNPEDAKAAIEKMNETELDGRVIKVEPSSSTKRPRKKKKAAPKKENNQEKKEENNKNKEEAPKKKAQKPRRVVIPLSERAESNDTVYAGALSESVTEDSLKELFKEYDVSNVIIRSSWRGRDKPKFKFAFITVAVDKRQKAIDTLNGTEFEGAELALKAAHKAVTKEQIDEAIQKQAVKPKKKKNRRKRKPKSDADGNTEGNDKSTTEKETKETPKEEKDTTNE